MDGRLQENATRQRTFGRKSDVIVSSLAVIALLSLAVLVRLPAFDDRSFWADELWRVLLVLDPHYLRTYLSAQSTEPAITSPLYAFFMKATSALYVSANTLRLSSFLPGVLAPVLAFAAIRKAGGNSA